MAESNSILAELEQTLKETTSKNVANIQELEKSAAKSDVAIESMKNSAKTIAVSSQQIALQKDTAALQTQNAIREAVGAFASPDVQKNMMETITTKEGVVQEIETAINTTLRDKPTGVGILNSIINNFKISQLEPKLEAAQNDLNSDKAQLATVGAATETFARINALTEQSITDDTIKSNQEFIAATANFQASEQEIKNIHSRASNLRAVMGANQQQLQNLMSFRSLQNTAQAMELRELELNETRKRAERAEKEAPIRLEKLEAELKISNKQLENLEILSPSQRSATLAKNKQIVEDVKLLEQSRAATFDNTRRGQSLFWNRTETDGEIEVNKNSSPINRERYDLLQQIGSSEKPIIAANSYDANEIIDTVAPNRQLPMTLGIATLDQIIEAQTEVYDKLLQSKAGFKIPKDEATRKKNFLDTQETFLKGKEKNIAMGDATNPYHSIPFGVLADNFAAVKNSVLYHNVLEAHAMKEFDPQRLVDATLAGIRSKAVTIEQAKIGLELIGDSAAEYNNSNQGGFERVGLPNQESYKVRIQRAPTSIETLGIGLKTAVNITPTILVGNLPGIPFTGEATEKIIGYLQNVTIDIDLMDQVSIGNMLATLMTQFDIEEQGEEK